MLDNNDNQEIEDEISPDDHQNTIGHWRFDSDGSQFDKELFNDNFFLNSNPNSKTTRSLRSWMALSRLYNDNLFLNSNHNSKTTRSLIISIILIIIVSLMFFVIMSQFRKNINTESRDNEQNSTQESRQL